MNLDPIHWLAVGLAVLSAILGLSTWGYATAYDAATAQYDALQAQRKSEIATANAEYEREKGVIIKRNSELEKEAINAKNDLNRAYADYKRMLSDTNRTAKNSLSDFARQLAESEAERTRLAQNLERFENGVIERILRSRDESIVTMNECLGFVHSFPPSE